MLVLTRRVGESVVIGDDVVVTVLEVKGDVVRVGVQAPRSIRVHRAEVYAAVVEANRAAAASRGQAVDAELSRLAAQRTADDTDGSANPVADDRSGAEGPAAARPRRQRAPRERPARGSSGADQPVQREPGRQRVTRDR